MGLMGQSAQAQNESAFWAGDNTTGIYQWINVGNISGTGIRFSAPGSLQGKEIGTYLNPNGSWTNDITGDPDLAKVYPRIDFLATYPGQTAAGWPALTTHEISDVWFQFSVSPNSGYNFHLQTLSFSIAGSGTSNMKASAYISTDSTFTYKTQILASKALGSYIYSQVDLSGLDTLVSKGKSIYLRFYPWYNNNSAPIPGKRVLIRNVVFKGTTNPYGVAISSDAKLKTLNFGNSSIAGFSPATTTYNIELPSGTIQVPKLSATVNESHATKVITNAVSLPGTSKVVVTAEDGSTLTYTVNFSFAPAQTLRAFPGAEGAGSYTTGGRGGNVYQVTNLSDAGVGSLRYGVETLTGARTIVFRVSGTIELTKTLTINKGDVTIAGQTAPGDGICLSRWGVNVAADNVIIRYLRFRPGDVSLAEVDAFSGRGFKNIIIDHCTTSWSVDEIASFYDNSNFTMQWCMLYESLKNSVHDKGAHGYTGIWGGKKASFHHNLLAHSDSRNPRLCGSRYSALPDQEFVDIRNNVMYNYGGNSGYGGEGGKANFINNYYKPGPATKSSIYYRIFAPNPDTGTNDQNGVVWGQYWVSGNYMDGSASATADNWQGLQPQLGTFVSVRGPAMTVSLAKEDYMLSGEVLVGPVDTQTATDAYQSVLDNSGASLVRDTLDRRIVYETLNKTYTFTGSNGSKNGLIDTQSDVGGWPVLNSTTPPTDTDKDGMPDAWETAHGLSLINASDRNTSDIEGYTMLEKYLNSIEFTNPVTGYKLTKLSGTSFELKWADNFLAEDSFIVERSVDSGIFRKIAQLPKYSNRYTDNQANFGTTVTYRVIAYNKDNVTPCTKSITYALNTSVANPIKAGDFDVKCYPNPFADVLNFEIYSTENQLAEIDIFDLSGQKIIYSKNNLVQSGKNTIGWKELAALKSGVYLCSVTIGEKRLKNKLLIKK